MLEYKAEEEFAPGAMIALKKNCDYRNEEMHTHDFVEIVYVLEGSGRHFVNEEEFDVKEGDILFINYGCTHSFHVNHKLVTYNLMIRVEYFTENLLNGNGDLFYLLSLTSFEELQQELNDKGPLVSFDYDECKDMLLFFSNLEKELLENELGKSLVINSYINLVLSKIFRKIFLKDNGKLNVIPKEILDYITEHYNEKLSLSELAQKCFYNPAYFSRLFKKTYDMSFTDYVMDIRLKHCCELLKNTDYAIAKIIEECGFLDRNTFYERFKKKYNCTPNEYRGLQ